MRIVNDRLSQFARIAQLQAQPQVGDNLLHIPAVLTGVLDLSDPIRRGGSSVATQFGTVADPLQESCIFQDTIDDTGVVGLDSRTLAVFAPGLWHLNIQRRFSFNGTTNFGKDQRIRIITLSADLGSIVFTTELDLVRFITGTVRDSQRDLWFPMLTVWSMTTLTQPTVAADELHSNTSVLARRFL